MKGHRTTGRGCTCPATCASPIAPQFGPPKPEVGTDKCPHCKSAWTLLFGLEHVGAGAAWPPSLLGNAGGNTIASPQLTAGPRV